MSVDPTEISPVKRALHALQVTRARLESLEQQRKEPIAVVGVGCRFPGADDPRGFWRLLRDGVDAITEVPADRWDLGAFYDPDVTVPGKMITRHGGFLGRLREFDPEFFGIAPREAVTIDPQQRLLLEVAWEALEHAGIAPDSLHGTATGVFVGICGRDYGHLLNTRGVDQIDAYMATGIAHSVASGRLSYFLGLHGPSVSVDTACSSSLVSLHLACQALRQRECDAALAAGVNRILLPDLSINFSKNHMLSPTGRCRTFDASADGFARGEGCGVVVLKRLSDALAADDQILAIVRGSALNQDGRTSGMTVPNGPAQQAVIRRALENADVDPADVSYVEAHGTGTALGDPIEIGGLDAVYGRTRGARAPLLVGSVKTNIGHLEAAAGIAGVIKVVLALRHRQIPPHLHVRVPTPHVDWSRIPIRIPQALGPWMTEAPTRLAGVSSFGFSGTNGHVILEEAPGRCADAPGRPRAAPERERDRPLHVLTISARHEDTLKDLARQYVERLSGTEGAADGTEGAADGTEGAADGTEGAADGTGAAALADICYTANAGRAAFAYRLAVRADSRDGAARALGDFAAGRANDRVVTGRCDRGFEPRVAFVFPGPGAARHGVARELYETAPRFREALQACDAAFGAPLGGSLVGALYGSEAGRLTDGAWAHAAAFALGYALFRLWESWGVRAEAVTGDDVGEYAAACAASVLGLDDAGRLVVARARRSGFDAAVSTVSLVPPTVRVVSGITGKESGGEIADPAYWRRHASEPSRIDDAMRSLGEIGSVVVLLGPRTSRRVPGAARVVASVADDDAGWAGVVDALAILAASGVRIDWKGFDAGRGRRIASDLPTYPFRRRPIWPELPAAGKSAGPDGLGHPLLDHSIRSALIEPVLYETRFSIARMPFIEDHTLFGEPVIPGACLLSTIIGAAAHASAGETVHLAGIVFQRALSIPRGTSRRVQVALYPARDGVADVKLLSHAGDETRDEGVLHTTGTVLTGSRPAPEPARWGARPIAELWDTFEREIGRARLYSREMLRDIHLGPFYMWVDALRVSGREVLARLVVPEPVSLGEGYQLHPGLIDACFALMVTTSTPAPDRVLIPFGVEELRYYRPVITRSLWAHARYRETPDGSRKRVGDIRLTDDRGKVIAEIIGLEGREADREVLLRGIQKDLSSWFYGVDWVAARLDAAPAAGPAGLPGSWLVLGDGAGLGDALATRLERRGAQVARALPGDARGNGHPWRGIVHVARAGGDARDPAHECGALLRVVQAAIRFPERPRLAVVTRGAQPALDGERVDATQGALWGLGRTITAEHPDLGLVSADVDRDPSPEQIDALCDELLAPGEERRIALRGDRRYVARLVRRRVSVDSRVPLVRGDASYLITGGLGALGLAVAGWLVSLGARRLLLASRRAPTREALDAIATLERGGATVEVHRADVARAGDVAALVSAAGATLRGVIHAAGVVDDGLLLHQDAECFRAVMAPKALGLVHLHEATRGLALDVFVAFSSLVTLLDVPGQGNYAAANAFVDAFMSDRRAAGLPATSIAWGPWAGAGMIGALAPRDRRRLAEQGFALMEPAHALRALGALLLDSPAQIGVMDVDWATFTAQAPRALRDPFLSGFTRAVAPPLAAAWRARLEQAPVDRRLRLLESLICEQIATVLSLPSGSEIGGRDPVFDLGVDSLMAVELQRHIETSLGRQLPATVIFDFPTVEALVGFLASELDLDLMTAPAPALPSAAPALPSAAPVPSAPVALDELANLSTDELAALLEGKLDSLDER